ncbi:MAG: 3-hydroxyacyl-CoA dehydrogenase [Proteobacteria bacterium]|nr:3-hydroxyacyl-CoA dehydrogenase [Pseudomonadota bacterium]
MKLDGAVAIITGGASGLGAATARKLIAGGASAVLVDRDETRGNALARQLGDSARFVPADVTDEGQVEAAVDTASGLGSLRIAVNCAGIGSVGRTLNRDGAPHPLAVFQKTIAVNLIGTFNVLRLAAAAMAKTQPNDQGERGVVISTASVAAFDGQIGQIAYSASKGGVAAMTLPAARDLAVVGVRVVTIAPGVFDTPMMAGLPESARQALAKDVVFPKRLGEPSEYADLVAAIVSSPYLNGETIRLDAALRMPPK